MPNGLDPAFVADSLRISLDISATGSVLRLETQGLPAWWAASQTDADSLASLLGLPPNAALTSSIAAAHGSAAAAIGVEAICLNGIGARLVRYCIQSGTPRAPAEYRVELSADPRLAGLEELLAKLYRTSHDLHTTTATVLASAQLLADAAPATPTTARNRDRIERAIRAALAADAENFAQASRKLAALGADLTRAT